MSERMFELQCPILSDDKKKITMAEGSGGGAMQRMIGGLFAKNFKHLQYETDGAVIFGDEQMILTTDSFVIDPIFFPGGDIGSLAVYGTVNDLAVMGAFPSYMTVSFVIKEGFPFELLEKIVCSLAVAAERVGVHIVTGDTKVVEGDGKGGGIFINTTGIGALMSPNFFPAPKDIKLGDVVIVSGDIGRHGMTIMAERNGMRFDPPLLSDSAPLNRMVRALMCREQVFPHCMRDATRGGLAAVLNEIATTRRVHICINEDEVPVLDGVRGYADMLGFDPLHIANEGVLVIFVHPDDADITLATLRSFEEGRRAAVIGTVTKEHTRGIVTTKTAFDSEKIIPMPEGELLPRIC
jgi:hydrogenase expression/formation protein HypE